MTSGEFDCLVVLGSALGDKAVTRDLLVGGKGDSTTEAVRNALEKSSEPSLQLQVRYDMGVAANLFNDRFLQAAQLESLVLDITAKEILQPLASRSCPLSRRFHLASDFIALIEQDSL